LFGVGISTCIPDNPPQSAIALALSNDHNLTIYEKMDAYLYHLVYMPALLLPTCLGAATH
jgi:hypothetical protein